LEGLFSTGELDRAMNLTEALRINQAARNSATSVSAYLATGFTPLSLSPLLAAHLSERINGSRIDVKTGTFGDLDGNIQRIASSGADLATVCVEWDDLDPRLGVRRLTPITGKDLPEILAHTRTAKNNLVALLIEAAGHCRIAISLPHCSFRTLSCTPSHLMDEFESELRLIVAEMQAELAHNRNLRVIRQNDLPCLDLTAVLHSGFPYTIAHASKLSAQLAAALVPSAPKKGIIVDLDDTLWKGILGDDGIDGVHWDLDHQAQHHGLLQQFLHALAAEGTLVAIASKNSPEIVAEFFAHRSDLLLKPESVFPMEVHWQPKSKSVARVLQAWNVAADSVIFLDDSALELAEVQAAHPEITCRLFPKQDLTQFATLLGELRETFAKETIGEEDSLRTESLRMRAALLAEPGIKADPESLLRDLDAELRFELSDASDRRAFQLVNKTNQFNINGVRIPEPLWRKSLERPNSFLLTCGYKDKFGALGKIAVLSGTAGCRQVTVEFWVMSCRAFARRIEFACLQELFEVFPVPEIVLQYRLTPRNGPVSEFLQSMGLNPQRDGDVLLTRNQFASAAPVLYHRIILHPKSPEVETYV
jgi:FkbH-like protein